MKKFLFLLIPLLHLNAAADFVSAMQNYSSGQLKEAYDEFKKMAELGEKRSQFNLGVMYFNGEYVPQDIYTGYAWLKLATESDSLDESHRNVFESVANQIEDQSKADAVYDDLAGRYSTGNLLESLYPVLKKPKGRYSSRAEAVKLVDPKWPRVAVKQRIQGRVRVAFNVDKNGIPRDITIVESLPKNLFDASALKVIPKWRFTPALDDEGNPIMQSMVTYTMEYKIDKANPISIKEDALQKIIAAAEKGSAIAQYKLGYLAQKVGLKQVENPAEWFLKSAVQGMPQAQFEVGKRLIYGHGCLAEPEKGIEWLNKAAAVGEKQSRLLLGELFTRKDDLKSQLLAKEYFSDIDKIPSRKLLAYIWMLVKSPHEEVSDPELALELLPKLTNSRQYTDAITPDEVRAAAYARMGKFKKAVSYQEDALEEAEDLEADTSTLTANLQRYKNKQLWL